MSEEIRLSSLNYINSIGDIILEEITANSHGIIVLGGGNSPKKINEYILNRLNKDQELKEHFYNNFKALISDERYVPITQELSNFKMLNDSLYKNHPNLLPYNTKLLFEDCIIDYSNMVNSLLDSKSIIFSLLGVGPDGHTASLFPKQFEKSPHSVIDGGLGPEGLRRMSLSHETLLSSKKIIFLVNSAEKEDALIKAKLSNDYGKTPLLPFIESKHSTFYTTEHKD